MKLQKHIINSKIVVDKKKHMTYNEIQIRRLSLKNESWNVVVHITRYKHKILNLHTLEL